MAQQFKADGDSARRAKRQPAGRWLDMGVQRARLAPKLTGEQIAELLALAEMTLCCGGSLTFGMRHLEGTCRTLGDMRLIEAVRPPEEKLTAGSRKIRLTKLGWLTLLTRCEAEMAHLLPAVEEAEGEAA